MTAHHLDTQAASAAADVTPANGNLAALSLAAVGIVYGDIGTSPLYALNQIFFGRVQVARSADHVLGGISLVIWTLTIIIAVKYAVLVLRAQNDGEGGVFALYGLLHENGKRHGRVLLWALMLGAGLLFGDGFITPAISVLSAVEGLNVATPALSQFVVPVTAGLLTALFAIQHKGTSGIGSVFGPVLTLWFIVIAALGAWQIIQHPGILHAFDPRHGVAFLRAVQPYDALLILGALMLVVTGGEAMYADLGHFGATPIRLSWFSLVFPALLLNYLGQGAYLLGGGAVAQGNLFFALVPGWALYPAVLLATAATIIASQALISGAFTLASQATRLGLFPRLVIRHTHHAHAGQIYLPVINWGLYAGCILLVVSFGSSTALGAAYGLAVSGVMVITSLAMVAVSRLTWKWGILRTLCVWAPLTAINLWFLAASTLKFFQGGWVPLSIGALMFAVMATWKWGRKATFAAYSAKRTMTVADLVELHQASTHFMERTALLMSAKPLRRQTDRCPALLQMLWERYGVLPRHVIFVEITHRKTPFVHDGRYTVTVFDRECQARSIIGVELQFGFMEEPNVERVLEGMARHKEIDLPLNQHRWIVHVSLENLVAARSMNWARRARFQLFLLLRRLSQPAYAYYGLGNDVQLSAEIIPVKVR